MLPVLFLVTRTGCHLPVGMMRGTRSMHRVQKLSELIGYATWERWVDQGLPSAPTMHLRAGSSKFVQFYGLNGVIMTVRITGPGRTADPMTILTYPHLFTQAIVIVESRRLYRMAFGCSQ